MVDHYTFDLDAWTTELSPFDSFEGCRGGFVLVGPRDIVCLEELRARARAKCDLGPSVPTDAFVFGWGKSPQRDMTKIDGVPYRPADAPWPVSANGDPMTFLVQYRFTESKDLVGDLPGEMLLVFIEDHALMGDSPRDFFRFEWYPLGVSDLCAPGALPEPGWMFAACYGLRHRTVDYSDDVPVEVVAEIAPFDVYNDYRLRQIAAEFSRVCGTKIGGLPTFPYDPDQAAKIPNGSRFLCSLSSIYPTFGATYPWVNVSEPAGWPRPEMYLDFRDGFVLDFWIGPDQEVSWVVRFM